MRFLTLAFASFFASFFSLFVPNNILPGVGDFTFSQAFNMEKNVRGGEEEKFSAHSRQVFSLSNETT